MCNIKTGMEQCENNMNNDTQKGNKQEENTIPTHLLERRPELRFVCIDYRGYTHISVLLMRGQDTL